MGVGERDLRCLPFDLLLKLMRSYFIDVAGKKSDILISSSFSAKYSEFVWKQNQHQSVLLRKTSEAESIREFFTSATIGSLIDLPFANVPGSNLVNGGESGIVPVVGVVVLIVYALLIHSRCVRPLKKVHASLSKYANLIESLAGLKTVKLFGAEAD